MHILFFDHWDKGIPFLRNSLKLFRNKSDQKCSLVHLSSYFSKESTPFYQTEGINIYDISYFKGKKIYEIIDIIKPTHILITNHKLYERIICIAANSKKIPVYFVQHGNIGPIFEQVSSAKSKDNITSKTITLFRNILLVKKYINIYLKLYYPEYVHCNTNSIYLSRNIKFIIFIINKLKNRFYDFELVEFPEDYFIDYGVVYSEKDVNFMKSIGVNICKYYINGNIELLNNVTEYYNKWSTKKQILIVDDGFTSDYLHGLSPDKMKRIIEQIKLAFSHHSLYADYDVVLKIKPHERTKFELMGINCLVERNESIYKCIQESELVVGTVSTALQYAIIERKPILILKWDEYASVPDVYLKYGIGNKWLDKNSIPEIKINHDKYDKYISLHNLDGKSNNLIDIK